MTNAKQEALKQALQYHYVMRPVVTDDGVDERKRKEPTPEQVIATAKKFETFLQSK